MPPFVRKAMPFLRSCRLWWRYASAERLLTRAEPLSADVRPPLYIVGCGRSGTTILASVLSTHPEVELLMEPYHLWCLVDARTDITNLFARVEAGFRMHESDVCSESRERFQVLIASAAARAGKRLTVEKTPHNVARLGFLEALCPESRYLNLVRNGLDVVRSIERIATTNDYRLAHRPRQNQWWGEQCAKWRSLVRYSRATGYLRDEVPHLRTHAQRGAYEWLVSLRCADAWRERLGERLVDVLYGQLASEPRRELRAICDFAGLSCPDPWLERAAGEFRPERARPREAVVLPAAVCDEFNAMQERFGFDGRALPADESREGGELLLA